MHFPYRNIVILTGAGISAESGIQTFRAQDGLWENHKILQIPCVFRQCLATGIVCNSVPTISDTNLRLLQR